MKRLQATAVSPGDIRLYDSFLPALEAGAWRIRVTHSLTAGQTPLHDDPLEATQEVVVSGPQFALDAAAILSQYPPSGSTGPWGDALPYLVLSDPQLPWERAMADRAHRQPWLALLLFEEGELVGGEETPTRTTTQTVKEFLTPDPAGQLLKPAVTRAGDIPEDAPCSYIQVPTDRFQALCPRLSELRYLAHCRQANMADRALSDVTEQGLFAVVVANRFPAAPPSGSRAPRKHVVHLVSLEGLEPYLVEQPDFGGHQRVAMVSLASWLFYTQPETGEDFRGLMEAIVRSQRDDQGNLQPERLWLRLPPPQLDLQEPIQAEALKRIASGFVPLAYRTRTGESTFAWYRGPLTPLVTTPLPTAEPLLTADAAIIYQSAFGLFDLSLAGAWELGRSLALADQAFGRQLFALRRRMNRRADDLLHRLQSDYFHHDQVETVEADSKVQSELRGVLGYKLLADIGAVAPNPSAQQQPVAPDERDPQAAVQAFLTDTKAVAKVVDLAEEEIQPVVRWLARLALLHPVPFHHLVPDERMLPVESLRFFYLDENWLAALIDGALSLGLDSSRELLLHRQIRPLIREAALAETQGYRDRLRGVVAASEPMEGPISGLLFRSAVVSGWPNLAVRATHKGGEPLRLVRMDRLSPNVLLCLFAGVPDSVEISEPEEGFRFGVNPGGYTPLRNLRPPAGVGDLAVGAQLPGAPPFPVRTHLREAIDRVLRLDPDSPAGLVQGLKEAVAAAMQHDLDHLGPADFALQMVRSPEAIRFQGPSSAAPGRENHG